MLNASILCVASYGHPKKCGNYKSHTFVLNNLRLHLLWSHGLVLNFYLLKNHPMDRHLDYLLLPWVTFLIGVYQLWMLRFHVALMSFCGFGYFSTVWAWKALRIARFFQNMFSVHWIIRPLVFFVKWTNLTQESLHTEHLSAALLELLSSTQRGKHLIFWSKVFEAGGRSKLMLCGSSNPCWCWSLSGNWCFWSGLQFSDSSITSSCCSWSMFSWFGS